MDDLQSPDLLDQEPPPRQLSGKALAAFAAMFLFSCLAGGYLVYMLLASRGVVPMAKVQQQAVQAPPAGQDTTWIKALDELFAAGKIKAPTGATDGGVIYSLPTRQLVVRQEAPSPRPGARPRARRPSKPRPSPPAPAAARPAPAPAPPPDMRTPTRAPRPRVVMYSTSWCGACKVARAWLRARRIAYLEKDPEKDPVAAAELRRLNPSGGVPTFVINGHTQVGFSPGRINYLLRLR